MIIHIKGLREYISINLCGPVVCLSVEFQVEPRFDCHVCKRESFFFFLNEENKTTLFRENDF